MWIRSCIHDDVRNTQKRDETLCNSRLLKSQIRLRAIGPITISSRVRDTTSCVFVPQSDGVDSVRL